MTGLEKDKAICCRYGNIMKEELWCWSETIRESDGVTKKQKRYLIDTQACIIHWKMTNVHVHKTKYAIRKKGKRCK